MQTFDVVIIGGGPGGINAGVILSQAGKTVALIQEDQDNVGGICLNRGCMPTKSLLKAATAYRYAKQGERYGLDLRANPVNLDRLRSVVDEDLATLGGMVQGMIAESQIATIRGKGNFLSNHEITVKKGDGSTEVVRGEKIIIATGSKPVELSIAPFDGQYILSSDQILKNTELPTKMLIIGGGAIGCEFATLYSTFGSEVILVEAQDSLLAREDREAGKMLQTAFENQGITVKTATMVDSLAVENGKVQVRYKDCDRTDTVDKVLVGVGRKPNIDGLNLEVAGIKTEQGTIKVNELMQTSAPHIYALGDVTGGLTLAHAAEREGQLLAQNIVQKTKHTPQETAVPRVAFCHPEVAAVGVRESIPGIRAFSMPQVPNGRTVVDKVAPAFVKLFIEEGSARIVGAIIIGEAATEMIHEMALAVENRLTLQQVGKTVHAHPTHSKNLVHAIHHVNSSIM